MPKSTAKAEALFRDLADRLSTRLAHGALIDTVRAAKDSAGWPVLILSDGGTETAGSDVIGLRISNPDMVSKDIFGNATSAYAPHILELAYELNGSAPEPSLADIFPVALEAAKLGARMQIKTIADGTAVTAANMDAGTIVADIEDLYWPTKSV